MNRIRPIFCKPALGCIALAALLGGPRLAEASNEIARRIAAIESKAKHSSQPVSEKSERGSDTPSFTAAPDACVAKLDTDGRWSIDTGICGCTTANRPTASHLTVDIRNWDEPIVSLHSPIFDATAPPL